MSHHHHKKEVNPHETKLRMVYCYFMGKDMKSILVKFPFTTEKLMFDFILILLDLQT